MKKSSLVGISEIREIIIEMRNQRVILDRHLAMLYGVSTRVLIQAVKRNKGRFPKDFMFQLNENETEILVSQNVIPCKKSFGGRCPYVFTRNGANMVSAILRTKPAIKRSIQIMRAFSVLEEMMGRKKSIPIKSPEVLNRLSVHSRAILQLFNKDEIKQQEIDKIKSIIDKMILMLQKIVFSDL